MLGDNLLVAPVVSETDNTKRLYLPAGSWFEMNTKKVYQGGRWILIDAPLSMIPLFVREGGFIPMQEVQQYVGEKKITETEMVVYPSDGAKYSLCEDDGISFEYTKGKYSITSFDCDKSAGKNKDEIKIEIKIKTEKNGYETGREYYLFKIVSEEKPAGVVTGGKQFSVVKSVEELKAKPGGYYYDSEEKVIYVKARDTKDFTLQVTF